MTDHSKLELLVLLALSPFALGAQNVADIPVVVPGAVTMGYALKKVSPIYPPIARAAHVSGQVVLHAIISKTGDIEELTVESGPEMLKQAALNAVRQWTYQPYLVKGVPVPVDTNVTVKFSFRQPPSAKPEPPLPADEFYASGNAKSSRGDMDGAIADYTQAIQLRPDFAEAYNSRGSAKQRKGDLDWALIDYARAIELNPGYAPAYNNRGSVERARGELGAAIADFTRAIELDPDFSVARNNLAATVAQAPKPERD